MASLSVTLTQTELLRLAKHLQAAALEAEYNNRNTATLTLDNAPATGSVSVVYASGTTRTV